MKILCLAICFLVLAPGVRAEDVVVSSGVLKTVVIHGSFKEWPSKDHYKSWHVYVTKPFPHLMVTASKAEVKKHDDEMQREIDSAERFPVAPDGSFRIIIHDAPMGDNYSLTSDNFGSQSFSVYSEDTFISTITPDSAE